MPEVHVTGSDFLRYLVAGIYSDLREALLCRIIFGEIRSIFSFRTAQFLGTFRGNHDHRKISQERKEKYFYPNKPI